MNVRNIDLVSDKHLMNKNHPSTALKKKKNRVFKTEEGARAQDRCRCHCHCSDDIPSRHQNARCVYAVGCIVAAAMFTER